MVFNTSPFLIETWNISSVVKHFVLTNLEDCSSKVKRRVFFHVSAFRFLKTQHVRVWSISYKNNETKYTWPVRGITLSNIFRAWISWLHFQISKVSFKSLSFVINSLNRDLLWNMPVEARQISVTDNGSNTDGSMHVIQCTGIRPDG